MRALATVVALCGLVTLLGAGGCASSANSPSYSTSQDADAAWLTGANKPPTEQTLLATARILVDQGKDDQAQFMLEQVIRERPTFAPAYVELAEIQKRRRNVDAAIEALLAGLRACPRDAVLLNDIGMCLVIKGQFDRALSMFEQAAAAESGNIRYRANAAMALGMLGRYEEALALYEQVLTPQDAHYNLAVLCEARKDFDRASLEFELAKMSFTLPAQPAGATAPAGASTTARVEPVQVK